jgi:excinuclease UvrABC helicase subunit UvrB
MIPWGNKVDWFSFKDFDEIKEVLRNLDLKEPQQIDKKIDELQKLMRKKADDLDFEGATKIREQIKKLLQTKII